MRSAFCWIRRARPDIAANVYEVTALHAAIDDGLTDIATGCWSIGQ